MMIISYHCSDFRSAVYGNGLMSETEKEGDRDVMLFHSYSSHLSNATKIGHYLIFI